MTISAMKQALEALNIIKSSCSEGRMAHAENEAAIAEYILRQAIAEAEKQEPFECPRCGHCCQREWVGLTDQEIWDISVDNQRKGGGFWGYPRALEAKLKEKNSPEGNT